MSRSGRCECGGVAFELGGELRPVVNCHCHRCRRITGHYMAATSVDVEQLRFDSDTTLQWYEASTGVFYGFCQTCGSSLFWKNDDEPHRVSVCAGTVEAPTGLTTSTALFMSEHADYHTPAPNLTEHLRD